MESANLRLARAIAAEWERGDYSSTHWDAGDVEFVVVDGPTPGSWAGAAEIREGWGAFLSAWEGFHAEFLEFRELDHERVLTLARFGGRGKVSGIELGQTTDQGATVFHFRDGKVARLLIYFDCERAFVDLGLPPEQAPSDA